MAVESNLMQKMKQNVHDGHICHTERERARRTEGKEAEERVSIQEYEVERTGKLWRKSEYRNILDQILQGRCCCDIVGRTICALTKYVHNEDFRSIIINHVDIVTRGLIYKTVRRILTISIRVPKSPN